MAGSLRIRVKRVYDRPAADDGVRILVDRLWPRGLKREAATLDEWLKDAAPSDELRRWFGHDPARWEEFLKRYWCELDERRDVWAAVFARAMQEPVTLLYAARDVEHNNAVALKQFLHKKARAAGPALIQKAPRRRGGRGRTYPPPAG